MHTELSPLDVELAAQQEVASTTVDLISEARRVEAAKPQLIAQLLEQRSQIDRDLHMLGFRRKRSKPAEAAPKPKRGRPPKQPVE